MTFPTVETTTTSEHNINDQSQVVSLPSGIVSGDLILVFLSVNGTPSITWPSSPSFTKIDDVENTGECVLSVAYRQSDGTEGATITITTGADAKSSATAYRISGHENPSTQAPEMSMGVTGTTGGPDPDNLTPTGGAEDFLWIAAHARDRSTTTTAAPTNYTNLLQVAHSDAPLGASTASARRNLNAASENPGTFTVDNNNDWSAATIAVHPAAGVITSGNLLI